MQELLQLLGLLAGYLAIGATLFILGGRATGWWRPVFRSTVLALFLPLALTGYGHGVIPVPALPMFIFCIMGSSIEAKLGLYGCLREPLVPLVLVQCLIIYALYAFTHGIRQLGFERRDAIRIVVATVLVVGVFFSVRISMLTVLSTLLVASLLRFYVLRSVIRSIKRRPVPPLSIVLGIAGFSLLCLLLAQPNGVRLYGVYLGMWFCILLIFPYWPESNKEKETVEDGACN